MSQFLSSKELFINIKNPPQWDSKKPYYEQSLDVLQFWEEEFRKMKEGVTIGGYFIHPWLYTHLNFFKTPIVVDGNRGTSEVIMNPPLDDNFLFFIEMYQEAERTNRGVGVFGTRGFAKSTILASLSFWTSNTRENGVMSVVGGDDKDLSSISSLIDVAFNNTVPALYLPRLISNWDKEVIFGVKEKGNYQMPYSRISITNADKGSSNQSEKGAGLSPVGFIADEIGKWNPKGILQSAIPSFMTPYGAKLVHVLSGTSGNKELSKEAKEIILNPDEYRLVPMNWDKLERGVPEEYITWERSKKTKYSMFVPGQMTYRLDVQKLDKPFGEFLGIDDPKLNAMSIKVTDWKTMNTLIKDRLESYKMIESKEKFRMYHPLEIDDVFLTEASNPFPTAHISNRIRQLEDEGNIGMDVDIYRDNNKWKYEFVSKKRADISHGGGSIDSPIILHQELPLDNPPRHLYVSGLDDYKLDTSETSSLGAMYVLKRRHMSVDAPCETIVASYTSRPDRHVDFHATCERLIEAWNAECCMEAIDVSFIQYLELKHKAEQMLAPSFSFSASTSKRPGKLNSKYGIFPNAQNKSYMFNLLVTYTKEEHVVGIDDQGNEIIKLGVDYIDDIDLLKEMLDWKPGGNFDRITAFMHALAYARELDKANVMPRQEKKLQDMYAQPNKKPVKRQAFGLRKVNPF
jgi:hypothetical protein